MLCKKALFMVCSIVLFWGSLLEEACSVDGPPEGGLGARPALRSVSRIAFGPADTLFVADWKESEIRAFTLPPAPATAEEQGTYFNLHDLDSILEATLHQHNIVIESMAKRPRSNEVYIAVSYGADKTPAIVPVKADGTARILEMIPSSSVRLDNTPDDTFKFWDDIPERSFTVTDMKWHDGELFVAGLSNQEFSSTLRRIPYPFNKGAVSSSSIEIYHAVHDQYETKAPIRAMTFAALENKPHLVAAYTCTPLVTIPLEELREGAHVHGKTIAELGYGNTPGAMISFTMAEGDGKTEPYILLTNSHRQADLMSVASIEEANKAPGITSPLAHHTDIAGLKSEHAPLVSVLGIDNQNDHLFVVLRRHTNTGKAELVSLSKHARFRLSDFISEYNQSSYDYDKVGGKQVAAFKPFQNHMKRAEGYPHLVSK